MKKQLILNKIQLIGFTLYFLILFIERLIALFLSVNSDNVYGLMNSTFIGISTYSITALSLILGTILFINPLIDMNKMLFKKELYDFDNNIKNIMIASMTLLFSGMMHTAHTIPVIQFIAYGFILLSLVAKTLENPSKQSVTSLIYISLFSMSIPVVYATNMSAPLSTLFYISEFVSVFALIPILGILFYTHYKNTITVKTIVYPLVMAILVSTTLALKWNEEINYFVLIASALTISAYIPFRIFNRTNTFHLHN